jgi:hypothetical protein
VNWGLLVTVVLLGWLVIALVVATIVGHGIAAGAGGDSERD